jgi:hypothetical protein
MAWIKRGDDVERVEVDAKGDRRVTRCIQPRSKLLREIRSGKYDQDLSVAAKLLNDHESYDKAKEEARSCVASQ